MNSAAVFCSAIFRFFLFAVQRYGWWMADMTGGFVLMGMVIEERRQIVAFDTAARQLLQELFGLIEYEDEYDNISCPF